MNPSHRFVSAIPRSLAWIALAAILGVPSGGFALQVHGMKDAKVPAGMKPIRTDMPGHMTMTKLRPLAPGDREKADAVVAAARKAMAPYTDYRKALADGYRIFLPDVPQSVYHFSKRDYGIEANYQFDPMHPTSLLYSKDAKGQYKLVGVMYTDRADASMAELNDRIPLSIAHWHLHTNFCEAPPGKQNEYFGPHAKYGLLGSITTEQECDAAGGDFYPHIFGWMVHVYPNAKNPSEIWSVHDDSKGHDNMDHSAMAGMPMQ
jgi:hypothetical protein